MKNKDTSLLHLTKLPDIITLLNLICGVLAIFFSFNKNISIAVYLIFAAVIFDFLDGKIARLTKRKGNLGIELDSLADLVSFGVAPAAIFYNLGMIGYYQIAILLFFICCGALRLARYNIMKTEMDVKDYYAGVPITINGILFPVLALIGLSIFYIQFIFILMGLLMISKIKIKKII
ncbi:CDP-diacylglycerol--serine O-phosphatidyltransferase [Nanoarchaeota archaeon]